MLFIHLFYLSAQCSYTCNKRNGITKSDLFDNDGPVSKKAKLEDNQGTSTTLNVINDNQKITLVIKPIQKDEQDICKFSLHSNVAIYSDHLHMIMQEILKKIPIERQKDFLYAHFEYTKETEIFNNHIQQQTNDINNITKQIEKCKNIKKNTSNFIELTEETKKIIYKDAAFEINHFTYKINNMKNYLIENDSYICNSFMEDDVIETFNLAEYMPECSTKYAHNKDIFEKQTETIKTLFVTGFIDFDEFFNTLDEEIDYGDNDKEILANLVDIQMNDFLHKNIKSLTLLFPKMQFFMEY
ncbi:hypothetical protein BDAP_000838 [Binucleata daphniae]